MAYKSKYFNLEKPGKGWTKEQLAWASEKLEQASRETLLNICRDKDIRLRFYPPNKWEAATDDEQIICALIADYNADQLISVIERHLIGHKIPKIID